MTLASRASRAVLKHVVPQLPVGMQPAGAVRAVTARARNRRFLWLSALYAHEKAPYTPRSTLENDL
jgi:hypothetical protein